jgi:hypothetical protein
MSAHQVVAPLGNFDGRQSVVMVGGAATATGRPPALGSWTAWRALWVGCVRESCGKLSGGRDLLEDGVFFGGRDCRFGCEVCW